MSDGPEWFAPKRYGYGVGLPISWQGWALTFGLVAMAILIAVSLSNRPIAFIAAMVPLLTAFIVIAHWTTRGGWRWRWGEEE